MAPLTLPASILLFKEVSPLYAPLGTAAIIGVCLLFFVVSMAPGPSFTNARCFLKYGPFGAGYWLARLYWPPTWLVGSFIDGPMSVGEIFLGASFWGCVGILWLWVL